MIKKISCLLLFVWLVGILSAAEVIEPEVRHLFSTELGLGYSSLFNISSLGKSKGSFGGNLQLGYELQYKMLLVHAGLELALVNNLAKINSFTITKPLTYHVKELQDRADYDIEDRYYFSRYKEKETLGMLNVPIMAGCLFQERYYFLAGAKVGVPLLHSAKVENRFEGHIYDQYLVGEMVEMRAHTINGGTSKKLDWRTNLSVQLSAEFGVVLNSFFPPKKRRSGGRNKKLPLPKYFRAAVFADYGIVSCAKDKEHELVTIDDNRDVHYEPYTATGKRVNSFLVGLKFAFQLQLNRPTLYTIPPTYVDIHVVDNSTSKPMAATLYIRRDNTTKDQKVTVSNRGVLHRSTPIGTFRVVATAANYFPDTLYYTVAQAEDHQQLEFRLRPFPKPEPKIEPKEEVIVFNDVVVEKGKSINLDEKFLRFATGKTRILKESEGAIEKLYQLLVENPEVRIRIVGHTDDVGTDEANQILSEGRANAVKQELMKRGIAPQRIETDGRGEKEPLVPNTTEAGRAKNRRVELIIL